MKYLKIIGLAAVAAAALMAFVGAGTASADELCSDTASPCTRITAIEASQVGTGKLTNTAGETLVTCTGGDIHIGTIKQGAGVTPITGTVEKLLFTGCSTTVTTTKSGTSSAVKGAGGGTTLTSIGGEVDVTIFGVVCTYGTQTGKDLGEVKTNGELSVNAVVNRVSGGFLCPETTKWVANFQTTNVSAVHYVTN